MCILQTLRLILSVPSLRSVIGSTLDICRKVTQIIGTATLEDIGETPAIHLLLKRANPSRVADAVP